MADAITTSIPLIVGLVGVVLALLDRGYGRFLEEQKLDPTIKFGGVYLLNFFVSGGIGAVLVTAIIPGLVSGLATITIETIVTAAVLQIALGYSLTYTALSKMNTSTERKLAVAKTTIGTPTTTATKD